VCRACGAILDKEKAATHGLLTPKRARREKTDASAETEAAGKPTEPENLWR
jgi:hypothetical protein